jgi:hypothetical protein
MTMTKSVTKSPKLKKVLKVKTLKLSAGTKRHNKVMDFDKEVCVDNSVDVDYHLYDPEHLEESEIVHSDEIEEIPAAVISKIKKIKIKEEKKKYYVDNDTFETLIQDFYDTDKFSDELAMILYNIANRVAFMPNFINYSYKDEMIGDGLLKEIQTIKSKKFDVKRGKAFNYFTTIVWNAFIGRIKSEQKEHTLLKEHQEREYDILTSGRRITVNDHVDTCD